MKAIAVWMQLGEQIELDMGWLSVIGLYESFISPEPVIMK
jgi:hypothetical protein